MTPILWGRPSSVNVQKVLWALEELGLSACNEVVGGRHGGTETDMFRAMAPLGRVPVLQEGDFALWESHAIMRHLAEDPAAAQRLVPQDRAARSRMGQWLEFTTSTLQPPLTTVFWHLVRLPEARRDPDTAARGRADLGVALRVLDGALGRDRWLAGPDFSLADIAAGALMHRITDLDLAPPGLAALARWHGALAVRPGYARHVRVSYEELRG